MMMEISQRRGFEIQESLPNWILVGYIICLTFIYWIIAGRRSFNFDEFQVIYASVGIIRKGALYVDRLGNHFPLANLIMSVPCLCAGYDAVVLIISRYLIFALNAIMLVYTYKICSLLWRPKAGLLAVCMVLSSFVFLEKGIEIRHDIFNTLFNVMGAYHGITYLNRRKSGDLVFSALFLGMAIASTQKASVMVAGFVMGLMIYLIYKRDYKVLTNMSICYFPFVLIPLVACLVILVGLGNDTVTAFLQNAVANVFVSFAPHTGNVYPFPYDRMDMFKTLFFANPLFYTVCISGLIVILLSKRERRTKRLIIGIWAAVGFAFYVTSKRPFFQTFLPAIPPLAIIGGGLLSNAWEVALEKWKPVPRNIAFIICFFFLFALPIPSILARSGVDKKFERALVNISFCVENLNKDDKVLCFTQNQIFFDPLLRLSSEDCGKRIYDYDADCLEKKMIQAQCRVIIYDYRTQLLSDDVKKRIAENYIRTKSGDILIPGFQITQGEVRSKNIWISGYYYSPTLSLEVNGEKLDENIFLLERGPHTFRNITDRPIPLVYIFDPTALKNDLNKS